MFYNRTKNKVKVRKAMQKINISSFIFDNDTCNTYIK